MTKVAILGLTLEVDLNNGQVARPPDGVCTFTRWDVLLIGRRTLRIEKIAASTGRRDFEITIDLEGTVGQDDTWRPTGMSDGRAPRVQVLPPGQTIDDPVWLDLGGGLGLRGDAAEPIGADGGTLLIRVEPIWEVPPEAPLQLGASGTGGVALDLAAGRATIRSDTLVIDTRCPSYVPGGLKNVFPRQHKGLEAIVELGGPVDDDDRLALEFATSNDARPLPLHAGSRHAGNVGSSNPLTAPMALLEYTLRATFARAELRSRLVRLQAMADKAGHLSFATFTVGDRLNREVVWEREGGGAVDLGLRFADLEQAGTFLFLDGGGTTFRPAPGTASGLHGLFPDAVFELPGAARLDLEARGAASHPAFAEGLLWRETLPILSAAGAEIVVAAIAKSGRGYAKDGTGLAETVALRGRNIAFPLFERSVLEALGPDVSADIYYDRVDRLALGGLSYDLAPTTHETRRKEIPVTALKANSVLRPKEVFVRLASADPEDIRPRYYGYHAGQLFGDFEVTITLPDGKPPDYVVVQGGEIKIPADAWARILGGDPETTPFTLRPLGEQPFTSHDGPVGVLKLSRTMRSMRCASAPVTWASCWTSTWCAMPNGPGPSWTRSLR